MSGYDPHTETRKGWIRRLVPITALRKKVVANSSVSEARVTSNGMVSAKRFLMGLLPANRNAQIVEMVASCQAQLRELSESVAKTSIELNQTRQLLEGYVRQCSVHCSNYEYVPSDPPQDLPVLAQGDPNESSIFPSVPPSPKTAEDDIRIHKPRVLSVRDFEHA